MNSPEIVQGSNEWFDMKRGCISGSKISNILMSPSTAGYRNYMARLALEIITDKTEETLCTYDMQRGIELEPGARISYAFETGITVDQLAWIPHPTIPRAGVSPDGVIGDVGGTEFKCPKAYGHMMTIITEEICRDYILQMQWFMACKPSMQWVDYVTYHPDFPLDKQLKIIRVERDQDKINELEAAAVKFNFAVQQMINDLDAACTSS